MERRALAARNKRIKEDIRGAIGCVLVSVCGFSLVIYLAWRTCSC